jgi:hypothetical protein
VDRHEETVGRCGGGPARALCKRSRCFGLDEVLERGEKRSGQYSMRNGTLLALSAQTECADPGNAVGVLAWRRSCEEGGPVDVLSNIYVPPRAKKHHVAVSKQSGQVLSSEGLSADLVN